MNEHNVNEFNGLEIYCAHMYESTIDEYIMIMENVNINVSCISSIDKEKKNNLEKKLLFTSIDN